jgi:hypothetical protein
MTQVEVDSEYESEEEKPDLENVEITPDFNPGEKLLLVEQADELGCSPGDVVRQIVRKHLTETLQEQKDQEQEETPDE